MPPLDHVQGSKARHFVGETNISRGGYDLHAPASVSGMWDIQISSMRSTPPTDALDTSPRYAAVYAGMVDITTVNRMLDTYQTMTAALSVSAVAKLKAEAWEVRNALESDTMV